MSELFYHLMHPLPNAIMTVIMSVMFVYWLVSFMFGGMDLDFDVGFETDVDVDFDLDIGATSLDSRALDTGDTSHHIEPGAFIKFLNFINIGKMPFMVIFTVFMFFMWVGSLVFTSIFNISSWGGFSASILLPILVCSIFLTKFTTQPLAKLFLAMGYKGEDAIDFLGRSGKMISTIEGDKIGAAEFVIESNPIRLNVKSITGEKIHRGEFVIIEDESEKDKCYLVSKELSLRNIN